jgi:hypothetical protein
MPANGNSAFKGLSYFNGIVDCCNMYVSSLFVTSNIGTAIVLTELWVVIIAA